MEEGEKEQEVRINVSSETVKELDETKEIENMKKIEAALFLSARFLNLQELVLLTDVNPLMLKELMEKLIDKYNVENSAIEIVIKENMWKMDVGKEYVGMVNKLATGSSEFSKTEQETLAIIAYKQPVKQSVIINIRGNKAYDHVKRFIEVGLVIGKRLGHTKELKLSDDFFDYFHLTKKDDSGIVGIEEDDVDVIDVERDEKGDESVVAVEEDRVVGENEGKGECGEENEGEIDEKETSLESQ